MATVASQLTRVHDVEGALTLTSIGGGAGGSANGEIVIQGAQSAARKQSNAVDHGFYLAATSRDVSGAGVHVGVWINHVHYAVLTKLAARLGSSTTDYHEHTFPLAAYPAAGGWVRFWINVSRTPEATGGTFAKAALTQLGLLASLPAVSGNAPNLVLDAIDFATGGLALTGTAGVWADFVAADEGSGTNKYGVVVTQAGVIFCLARLTLGSASSLAFSDANFVIVFPNQSRVAANFMGVTCDLQHASTSIAWSNGVIRSAGAVQGDLIVSGAAGALGIASTTLASLRTIVLTSACTLTSCLVSGCGLVEANGASLLACQVAGATGTTALLWDVAVDTNGKLDGTSFASAGTGHGLTLGANCPSTIGLTDVSFSGYGADGTADAALFNDSGKAITISRSGGTSITVRNGTGASTVINESVSLTISANVSLVGAEIRIYDLDTTPPDFGTELAGTESHGAATYGYSGAAGNVIVIQIMLAGYVEFVQQTTMPTVNGTLPIVLTKEQNA